MKKADRPELTTTTIVVEKKAENVNEEDKDFYSAILCPETEDDKRILSSTIRLLTDTLGLTIPEEQFPTDMNIQLITSIELDEYVEIIEQSLKEIARIWLRRNTINHYDKDRNELVKYEVGS